MRIKNGDRQDLGVMLVAHTITLTGIGNKNQTLNVDIAVMLAELGDGAAWGQRQSQPPESQSTCKLSPNNLPSYPVR